VICVQALVIPHCVIPIHEFVKILELESIFLVRIIPFFDFTIGLRVLNTGLDVFYIIFF
jgi:hypothetical protein